MAITRPGKPQAGRDQISRASPPGSGVQQEIDRALMGAYRVFAREHPRWAQAQFDERFLHSRLAPLLAAQTGPKGALTPEVVVQLWAGQRPWFNAHTRRAAMQALMPAAEEFLSLLAAELAWP